MIAKAPRKRMYRTMQGKMVDIEKLRAANESVRAVGNMNVNAKGDVLGPGGSISQPKTEIMAKYYEKPRGMVDDTPSRAKTKPIKKTPTPVPQAQQQPVQSKAVAPKKTTRTRKTITPKKGIDAALDGLE